MSSTTALHIASPPPRPYHHYAFVPPKTALLASIKTERMVTPVTAEVVSSPNNPIKQEDVPVVASVVNNSNSSTIIGNTAANMLVSPSPVLYGTGASSFDCMKMSSSTSCRFDRGNSEIRTVLERYQQLVQRESHLVQQLGTCDMASSTAKNLGMELHSVLNLKMNELKVLVGEGSQNKESPPQSPQVKRSIEKSIVLFVEEQPTGNVVANKYLEPPLVVRVDDSLLNLARDGKLQVAANLCLTLSDEVLSRTLDNKQDILQGHTQVPVSSEGYVTFNKLKIMEVSSKHHHQAFSIQLQLQEICSGADGNISVSPIGEVAKLAPLHVQSRINKRKRSCFSGHASKPRKRTRGESDCNYVDITPLLVLPQKEAATRLGISESMLCKRFKECTRRKWPYRYLRKIDKMIRVLTLNKKSDSIPREDQEKIQRLKREREECLHPVKIRITGHDKSSTVRLAAGNFNDGVNSSKLVSKANASDSESDPTDSNSSPYEEEEGEDEEEEYEEEDEISQVASTLSLLKKRGY